WQMNTPRVRPLDSSVSAADSVIMPVYPLTGDLRVDQLRPILRHAVNDFGHHLPEILPEELRRRHQLAEAVAPIPEVHFPSSLGVALAARRRFIYEEFLLLQLGLALRRRDVRDRQKAPVLTVTPQIDARIRRLFPFKLTEDQDRAVAHIAADLGSDRP